MRPQIVRLVFGLTLSLPVFTFAQTVTVKPSQTQGSRTVEKQTEAAVIRDYLQAWKTLDVALNSDRADQLDAYFVGTALSKLSSVVADQTKAGIHTHYAERSHDLQIIFYSPEGLSIQLSDDVEYEEQVFQGNTLIASKVVKRRYLAVLTPSEVRWRVRILQPVNG
jgi:hypothetical protein